MRIWEEIVPIAATRVPNPGLDLGVPGFDFAVDSILQVDHAH